MNKITAAVAGALIGVIALFVAPGATQAVDHPIVRDSIPSMPQTKQVQVCSNGFKGSMVMVREGASWQPWKVRVHRSKQCA